MTCFSDLESLPGLPGTRWHLSVLPTPLARGASISDRLTRSVARSALPVGIRYSASQSGKTQGEGVPLHFICQYHMRADGLLEVHAHFMLKLIRRWFYRRFSIVALLLALMLSACATVGNSGAASNSHTTPAQHSATVQPTRSIAVRQPITYVALRASDAVGVGSDQPGSQGYVPLVAAHLPKGSRLINLGVSGIQLHAALTEELPLALSIAPKLVTIWLVANDFVGGVSYSTYIGD